MPDPSSIKGRKFRTTAGVITVNEDGIWDEAGVKISEDQLVNRAMRNAKQAQENANTGRGSDFGRMAAEVANRGLQQNAESARDALLEYNTLRIKAPKKD